MKGLLIRHVLVDGEDGVDQTSISVGLMCLAACG